MDALYPPESNCLDDVAALQKPNVCFLGIEEAGELVACGAAKSMHDGAPYGEIKRLFVLPPHRGKGHARRLMLALEQSLRERGLRVARLELGISQPEALALYESLGYRVRGPYGAYTTNPHSIFMEKALAP
jgi:putative acetyltransferase